MRDQIDIRDSLYALERLPAGVRIVESIPAPLSVFEDGEYKGKIKINPHVSRFKLSSGEQVDVFHIKPIYYQHVSGSWRPMSEITTYHGNRNIRLNEDWSRMVDMRFLAWLIKRAELLDNGKIFIPSPIKTGRAVPLSLMPRPGHAQIHLATLTAYPDPNPETTTFDATCQGNGGNYPTSHDAANASSTNDTDTGGAFAQQFPASSNRIQRYEYLFDTSALTTNATISGAVASFYGLGAADSGDSVNVYSSNPASNTGVTASDYSAMGTTAFATAIACGSWNTSGYNDFTLNASGLAAISKTGVSKYAGRCVKDVANTNSSGDDRASCWFADDSGTSRDPKLVVTYTVISPSSSVSPSASASVSPSSSVSRSASSSASASISPSASTSPSASLSPSSSVSPSASSSASSSASASVSPSSSVSPSASSSASASLSPSSSPSASPSPSPAPDTCLRVVIEDVDRTDFVDPETFRITQIITSQPDTCDFVIKRFGDRTYAPSVGDTVVIKDNGEHIFAGVITEIDEDYDVANYVGFRVLCSDYSYKLDARLVVDVFEHMTVNEIIAYLKEEYFPSDVTINNVDCDVEIAYAAFNYEPVSQVLAKLAELAGADWYIDYYKDVHFSEQNSVDAPFNLSDSNGKYIYDSLFVRRDQTQLRNVIYVRGGEYLGDTVTAVFDGNGAQRFFYLPYKMNELTVTVTGAQKSVGVDPIDDPNLFDAMHNFQEKTVFFRTDRIPRDTSALTAANKVRLGGNPYLPVIWKQRDVGSIETYTAREYVVVDASIKSKEGARQRAIAELLAYKATIAEAEFETYENDLHTGQKITVQSDLRGLNEDYIINKIETRYFGMQAGGCPQLVYRISLVTTRTFGLTQLLQRLLNKEKKDLVIQEGETLDTVESADETITLADTTTAHIPTNPMEVLVQKSFGKNSGTTSGNDTTIDCTGADALILVVMHQSGISGFKYAGVALTKDAEQGSASIWRLNNPTTGVNSIEIVPLASDTLLIARVYAVAGINTADPVEGSAGSNVNTPHRSLSVSQASNIASIGFMAAQVHHNVNAGWTPDHVADEEDFDGSGPGGDPERRTTALHRIFARAGTKTIGTTFGDTPQIYSNGEIMVLYNGYDWTA